MRVVLSYYFAGEGLYAFQMLIPFIVISSAHRQSEAEALSHGRQTVASQEWLNGAKDFFPFAFKLLEERSLSPPLP